MQTTRRAAVAGRWYSDDRTRLASEVDEYVGRTDVDPPPRPPRAIVAPHAGLMYSGPVAAFAYAAVKETRYRAIVLVGPSHFVAFRGVSVWSGGAWDTPFGPVAVDRALAAAIRGECGDIVVDIAAAHQREHSLEMQLPFIAHLLPGAPIVPLVMGDQTREVAFALADAFARAIAANAGDPVLLVASSDLSHYQDAASASALDAVVMRHVDALDSDGLMSALEHEPAHACGGGPMVTVLRAARELGAHEAKVLRYADSGDVSGDKSSVVGYMAAVIW